jgi:predicted DNA-binding transcriptional regulator YafY
MLKTGKKMNASTLATHFEVDRKSIQRDITFVRDRLKMPISYNPHTNSIETL